jgi:arginase
MQKTSVIGVPMYSLAKYSGMGAGSAALKGAGAVEALGASAVDAGDVPCPQILEDAGPADMKNFAAFVEGTSHVTQRFAQEDDQMVVALGGECSLVVGEIAGLKRAMRGTPGMLWMDTHGDFNTPGTTPSGYIGGMCLAFACGRGPSISKEVDSMMPLVNEANLVHFGSRDLDPPELAAMRASPMELITMTDVKRQGFERSLARGIKFLVDRADWIILHVDLDVTDPSLIPAVNYPTSGGMTLGELSSSIRATLATGKLGVLNIAAYNSDRDPGGVSAKRIVSVLSEAFSQQR